MLVHLDFQKLKIDQYEKNLEALKSERRLKLESLMEQNKASEDEIKRYLKLWSFRTQVLDHKLLS